jgi:hypothetical protein
VKQVGITSTTSALYAQRILGVTPEIKQNVLKILCHQKDLRISTHVSAQPVILVYQMEQSVLLVSLVIIRCQPVWDHVQVAR